MRKPLEYFTGKKNQLTYIFLFVFILLTISLACSLPFKIVWTGGNEVDQQATDQARTALAESLTAEASANEEDTVSGVDETSATAELPSETPSLTPSPTITETPTPEQVAAFISKNTNCRVGPKDVFELIHIFLKGDIVDMLGKNQDETFWYVQDQDEGSIQCWIWSEYATPEGLTENLPVFTP
ncbi:MAG: hypothetical protein MUP11_13885, partial [Anaerolineales bacterium]|nr:hypothetical protein [Anaerolineales bacterium]